MKRKILVTNALPYANGPLHLGHMVGFVLADIWSRMQIALGNECIFLSGSDGHGTPIMIHAEKKQMKAEDLISAIAKTQLQDLQDFSIALDHFHTTHSAENQELVNTIYKTLLQQNYIEKRTIQQFFDPLKKMFLPDRYIKGTCPYCKSEEQYGDSCEVCSRTYDPTELINPYSTLSGSTPLIKETEHYFFKLEKFKDFLSTWTKENHLQPEVSNKLAEWFAQGLRDWDISRDAPYFGFKIPDTNDKYFYVWLDAPIGYLATLKSYCQKHPNVSFDEFWKDAKQTDVYHFIGKDIIYFHALFWPAVLRGANLRTPTAIFAHGFLTINGQKMSKSRGTFVDARTFLNHFNPDFFRYYLASKQTPRIEDFDLNYADFIQKINADLIGKYVNIASRSASFINKHFNNRLADKIAEPKLFEEFLEAKDEIAKHYINLEYAQAIRKIMALSDKANQYFDHQKPWELIKTNAQQTHLVCTFALNLFRILSIYLQAVLPQTNAKIKAFLQDDLLWEKAHVPLLNHDIKPYTALLQRIEPDKIRDMTMTLNQDNNPSEKNTPQLATENNSNAKTCATENTISIEDFSKIDLRIAKVIACADVEGAEKLLHLTVDLGSVQKQIFAGIKKSFKAEDLIGKHVLVVANLAPRKMRFGTSEGMMLVASDDNELVLVDVPNAKPGMKVK